MKAAGSIQNKREVNTKLFMIGMDDRSLKRVLSNNWLINYRFGDMIVPVHEEKLKGILRRKYQVKNLPRFLNESRKL